MRRLLLRIYPARWRERYGDELLDLLDETGLGPREALDLARGGVAQRASELGTSMRRGGLEMVIGPAWRHPTGWAFGGAVILAPTLVFVALSYLAYELGLSALAPALEPVNDVLNAVRPLDLLLVLAPVLGLLAAVVPLLRLELRRGEAGTEAMLGLRLRVANLVVALLALLLGGLLIAHIVVESVLQVGA